MSTRLISYYIENGDRLVQKTIADTEANRAIAEKEAYDGTVGYVYLDVQDKPAGSIARKLLWESEFDLLSQFAAKTITIDNLSEYDGVEVVFVVGRLDGDIKTSGYIPKSSDGDRHFILDNIYSEGSGYTAQVHHRRCVLNDNSIQFLDCTKCNLDGSKMETYNYGCIPIMVYGIKGVT